MSNNTNSQKNTWDLDTIGTIVLSIVSFFTSFTGIISYLGGFENTTIVNAILFALVVTLIQILLVVCLHIALSDYPFPVRVLTFIGYVFFMLISVFFSYAFYYDNLRADSFAVMVYDKKVTTIKDNAENYKKAFENIRSKTDRLATRSSEKASREAQIGGTCDGKAEIGVGKFNQLRILEKKHFNGVSENVNVLVQQVETQITDFEAKLNIIKNEAKSILGDSKAVQAQELELNNMLKEINGITESSEMKSILYDLDSHSGDNRKNLRSVDPFKDNTNVIVKCLDPDITKDIEAIKKEIKDLKPIPEVELFDPNDKKVVIGRSLLVFSDFFSIGEEKVAIAEEIETADKYPLLAGALVDLMIFFVGVLGIYVKQYNEPDPFLEPKAYLESDESTLLNHVEKYVQDTAWGLLLVLPNIAKRPTISASSQHIQAFGESMDKDVKKLKLICSTNRRFRLVASDVPIQDLPPSLQKKYESSNIPSVTIYSLSLTNWKRFVVSLL